MNYPTIDAMKLQALLDEVSTAGQAILYTIHSAGEPVGPAVRKHLQDAAQNLSVELQNVNAAEETARMVRNLGPMHVDICRISDKRSTPDCSGCRDI
jgi:hypothetical protein